jgi:hypothetical protein
LHLVATAFDAAGHSIQGASLQWSSSDASIVAIDPTGLATTRATGTATITVTAQGKSASQSIAVHPGFTVRILTPTDGGLVGSKVRVMGIVTAPTPIFKMDYQATRLKSASDDSTWTNSGNILGSDMRSGTAPVDTFYVPVLNESNGVGIGSYEVRVRVFDQHGAVAYDSVKFTVPNEYVSIERGLPDTLYQRTFVAVGTIGGPLPWSRTVYVLDAGTATEHLESGGGSTPPLTWRFKYQDTLSAGPHTFTVRILDSAGTVMDTVSTHFIVARESAAYTLTPLPTLGSTTAANDINASGAVVGSAIYGTNSVGAKAGSQAVVVWEDGQLRALPSPDSIGTVAAVAINAAGDVGENLTEPGACKQGVVWPRGATTPKLIDFPTCAWLFDLNDNQDLLLQDFGSSLILHGDEIDSVSTLDCQWSRMNNQRQAVGWAYDHFSLYGEYTCGRNISFGLPNRDYGRQPFIQSTYLNDAGDVAGSVGGDGIAGRDPTTRGYAVVSNSGVSVDLGLYLGFNQTSNLSGLNNRGIAPVFMPDTHSLALFDIHSHRVTDVSLTLNGWVITSVVGMNDDGVIAANATDPASGYSRAVILSPASSANKSSPASQSDRRTHRPPAP